MCSIKLVTGDFVRAVDALNIDVAMTFMTERGPLWGFSKEMVNLYPEVKEMLNIDLSKHIGQYQYRRIDNTIITMGYISSPVQQRMNQNQTPLGLKESIRAVAKAMVYEGSRRLLVPYPGVSCCGTDIYGFNKLLKEACEGLSIDLFVPVNPMIGEKYCWKADVLNVKPRQPLEVTVDIIDHINHHFNGAKQSKLCAVW